MQIERFTHDDLHRDAKVDCEGCTICCHHQRVAVFPGLDPIERYDVEEIGAGNIQSPSGKDLGPILLLKQRPDGSCIHLGPKGCEVYEFRPRICRSFDCGAWFRSKPRPERQHYIRKDPTMRPLIERGRVISARQMAAQTPQRIV
jgi:Fe-S-cluster containining protein